MCQRKLTMAWCITFVPSILEGIVLQIRLFNRISKLFNTVLGTCKPFYRLLNIIILPFGALFDSKSNMPDNQKNCSYKLVSWEPFGAFHLSREKMTTTTVQMFAKF